MGTPPTTGLIESAREGTFLTRARIKLWAIAVLTASVAGLAYLVLTAHGVIDTQGRPLGTDFSNVYAAGTWVLDGHPEAPFDPALQHAREQAIFGAATPFYGWHYPPFFLTVAALLALMPYGLALLAWQGTTLVAYLLAIRALLIATPRWARSGSREVSAGDLSPPANPASGIGDTWAKNALVRDPLWLLLAIAFPAVFVNLGHGHNGFLTAALLSGGLVLLDRRPLTAGLLLGLLAYKPQFGVMIPLVLVATGRWRTFATAAATVVLLALATTLAFGPDVWRAFAASTRFTREVVLEAGNTGWHKIQSVFALVRMWGGSVELAYAAQTAVSACVALALMWLWRSGAPFSVAAAALAIGTILATPYSLDYDMMVLAPAIASLAAHGLTHGFRSYEKSALAFLWLVPLLARVLAAATLIPIGVLAMLLCFVLLLRRTKSEQLQPIWLSVSRTIN
jgi:hypothetical protein